MQYTINQLEELLSQKVNEVYDIFVNYFQEQHVDFAKEIDTPSLIRALSSQRAEGGVYEISDAQLESIKDLMLPAEILIWWPEVTVTNEYDKSIVLYDVFVKVKVDTRGKIPIECSGFELTKTTYTEDQYCAGYQHSHTPGFRLGRVPSFQNFCLGRGPINQTIQSLKMECDNVLWMLFCEELSRCVKTESIRGVPYIKLESCGKTSRDNTYTGQFKIIGRLNLGDYVENALKNFTKWYLEQGRLPIVYNVNAFVSGLNYYEFIINISNSFIEWFNLFGNEELLHILYTNNVLTSVLIVDRKFMKTVDRDSPVISERHMLTFKGEPVNLKIISSPQHSTKSTLLSHNVAVGILLKILKIINYRYNGNSTNNEVSVSREGTSPTSEKVIYL